MKYDEYMALLDLNSNNHSLPCDESCTAGCSLECLCSWRLARHWNGDYEVGSRLQIWKSTHIFNVFFWTPWERGKILLHETSKSRCKSFSFLPGHFCLDRSVMMKTSKTLNLTNLIPSMISLPSSAKLSLELLIDLYVAVAKQSTQW